MVNDSFRSDDGAFRPRQDAQNFTSAMREVMTSGVGAKHVVLLDKNNRQIFDIPMTYALIGGIGALVVAPVFTLVVGGVAYATGARLRIDDTTTK